MREQYYDFLLLYGINDTLSYIDELSYSDKIKILQKLLNDFEPSFICKSLNLYYINYIVHNRVRINLIYNTLKGICQRLKETEYDSNI